MTILDPLTDPALAEPRREAPYDPMAGHRAHMERIGQAQWVEGAFTRAFNRPIEEVRADLEAREKAARLGKPAAKKAASARKPQPPKQRPGS